MKKARIILAMLLALSVFSFAGCGDKNDNADNGATDNTTVEETTDKAAKDGDNIKDDVEDLGDDVKDGAEDMLNGTDKATDGTQKDSTKETTK